MNRLSSGDTDVSIPGGERRDELGTMAQAVDIFRRNMIETLSLRETQEADKQRVQQEKLALQRQMAERFEADVRGVMSAVTKATTDMQRVAGEITTSVAGTSRRTAAAAAAVRGSLHQRLHRRRSDRGVRLLRRRDRPPGRTFRDRSRSRGG